MTGRLIDTCEAYRVATDYEGLQEAILERVEDLNISRVELNDAANLQPNYAHKLLCQPPMKRFGMKTLGPVLEQLGLAIVLVVDDERFAPVKAELRQRKRVCRSNGTHARPIWLFTREKSLEINANRWRDFPESKRKKMVAKCRKAARNRWKAQRARERRMRAEAAEVNASAV